MHAITNSSEILTVLRKLDFPHSVKDALYHIEHISQLSNYQTRHSTNPQQILNEIMDEFIFCNTDYKSKKKVQPLNYLQQLQIIDILSDYFLNVKNDVIRNVVFMNLFHIGQTIETYKIKLLANLVSLSITMKNIPVLTSAAIWIQQQGCSSVNTRKLIEPILEDFFKFIPDAQKQLKSLPSLTPLFASNFLAAVAELFYGNDKDTKIPYKNIVNIVIEWITSENSICIYPINHTIQNLLPRGSIVMPAVSAIGGLLRWSIFSIFEESITTNEEKLYAHLHYTLLQIITDTVHNESSIPLLNVKQIVNLLRDLQSKIYNDKFSLSLNRLAQAIHALIATKCLSGNIGKSTNK